MKYFWKRKMILRVEDKCYDPKPVFKGIPQESILSPLLYTIYTMELDGAFMNGSCKILQYADDIVLLTRGKKIREINMNLQNAINILSEIFSNLNLKISKEKSQLILFTRHRKFDQVAKIKIDDSDLSLVNEIKYLKVWFDYKMKWNKEIENIRLKCEKGLNLLRKVAGISWGGHQMALISIYKAVIRSHLDYSATLIDTARNSKLEVLNRIQNAALRICLGCIISTPVNVLNSEASEPPLHIRRKLCADKIILKQKSITNNPLIVKLNELNIEVMNSSYWANKTTPLLIESFNIIQNLNIQNTPISPYFKIDLTKLLFTIPIDLHTFKKEQNSTELNALWRNKIMSKEYERIIFTDGSINIEQGKSSYALWEKQQNLVIQKCFNFICSS